VKTKELLSRREVIKSGAVAIGTLSTASLLEKSASAAGVKTRKKSDSWDKLKVGVASYSFLKKSREETIKSIQRVGLKYVSIKDVHIPITLSSEERRSFAQEFIKAGITPLSCGNFNMTNDEANIRSIFQYAKDIGVPTIVCQPDPASMPILDKLVKEFDIKLAIHNHGPKRTYPSPYDVWKRIEGFDKRIGLCIDIGHTLRAKVDPAESILKCQSRLYDVHLKDLDSDAVDAHNMEMGRGVMDFPSIFKALLRIKFQHHVGFEYEKDMEDPLPGLAESVGYTRGVLINI
jgi:inosose dehydratase